MKGWESTSEMMEALKLLALAIFLKGFFFSLLHFQVSEASLAFRAFHLPPSFLYLLRPSLVFQYIFFFYLLNKLLRDTLMYPVSSNRFISRHVEEQKQEAGAGNKPPLDAVGSKTRVYQRMLHPHGTA